MPPETPAKPRTVRLYGKDAQHRQTHFVRRSKALEAERCHQHAGPMPSLSIQPYNL
jgi:hypothetical protein